MSGQAFVADDTYGEVPYRITSSGEIEVLLHGCIVHLTSIEQLIAVASGGTSLPNARPQPTAPLSTQPISLPPPPPDAAAPVANVSKKRGRGKVPSLLALGSVVFFLFFGLPSTNSSGRKMVEVLNIEYGRVAASSVEGWHSDTLRLEWTAQTKKLNAVQVMAAVGMVKGTLYNNGIRYFKFPNDTGGYNIIDWKTGEKKSSSERARYYFP
jgi:hypothetical protein